MSDKPKLPPGSAVRLSRSGFPCRLEFNHYHDGGARAMTLIDTEDGEPVQTCTVNVPEILLRPGEVLIKLYSENEGLLEILVAAGVVEDTGRRYGAGYVEGGIAACRLLVDPET